MRQCLPRSRVMWSAFHVPALVWLLGSPRSRMALRINLLRNYRSRFNYKKGQHRGAASLPAIPCADPKNKKGGMIGLRLCRRTFVPTPQQRGGNGGLRFSLRTPLPTPATQKRAALGGLGRAAVLPANSHADPRKKCACLCLCECVCLCSPTFVRGWGLEVFARLWFVQLKRSWLRQTCCRKQPFWPMARWYARSPTVAATTSTT